MSKTIDEQAIKAANGQKTPSGKGVIVKGWEIETNHAPISGDAQLEQFKGELGDVMNIPEQTYGNNFVTLKHLQTGLQFQFTALGALKDWNSSKLPPVRVGTANAWIQSRINEVQQHNAAVLEYDWTYSSPYSGCVTSGQPDKGLMWVETSEQMDRSMLLARDPILLFDEVLLYESELDDNGVSHMAVKVRVMPRFWYVLLRFFLRVDKVMVRLWETRIFCPFADEDGKLGSIIREVRHCEGEFAELSKQGAPSEGAAYSDAEAAASTFQATAPIGLKAMLNEKLLLLDA